MKLKKHKIVGLMIFLFFILHTNIYAATMNMSINKTSAYVGESFTVTISGINGRVTISGNSNISIDKSGSQWVDGSLTITGTTKAVGTGTITVTPVDVTTTAAEPEEVTTPSSRSITRKEKEEPQTPQTTPTNPSNGTTNTTKKPTTSTTKTEDKKSVTEDFYISKVNLKGIKENGEQVDIILSPEFNKDTYEYTCNISADTQKIELEKDAGKYTNSVIVTGLEDLKEGENIVKLQLSAENKEAKIYNIKVIKAPKEEVEAVEDEKQDENIENVQETKTTKMISMPLYLFIIMQVIIIVIEISIIYFVFRRKINKLKEKIKEYKSKTKEI